MKITGNTRSGQHEKNKRPWFHVNNKALNPIMGGSGKFAVPTFFLIIHDEEFNFLTPFFFDF